MVTALVTQKEARSSDAYTLGNVHYNYARRDVNDDGHAVSPLRVGIIIAAATAHPAAILRRGCAKGSHAEG